MMIQQRTFIPGSQWLYFKIYTGNKTADKILARNIYTAINRIKKEHLIDKWFFIRYSDPDFHLRLRLLICNLHDIGSVIQLLHQQFERLLNDKMIWKIQLDTYNRELERYGNKLIDHTESLFFYDSECAVSIIKRLILLPDENYRWMIALKIVDILLSDFHFEISEKQALMKNMSESFKTEFGFNKYNSKQFNTKFRENKKVIESVLNNKIEDSHYMTLISSIKKRSKNIKPVVSQIEKESAKDGKTLQFLLSSYIHMSLNRLFRSKNRMHELILYDFLFRYYTSEIARNKMTK